MARREAAQLGAQLAATEAELTRVTSSWQVRGEEGKWGMMREDEAFA